VSDDTIILMCARFTRELYLPDNVIGRCTECGCKVQFRPHAPRPHRLRCMQCAFALIEPGAEITTTPRMVDDLLAYFRKRQN
jgi:hypothetical protein